MSAWPGGADAELRKSLAVIHHLERELERARAADNEPIAIVGMACRLPGGANDPDAFWRMLERGEEGRRGAPPGRWLSDPSHAGYFLDAPIDGLDDRLFRLAPEEIRSLDPQQRLLLELTWEALENAGIPPSSAAGTRTGVFVGIEKSDYAKVHLASGDASRIGAYAATGVAASTAAGRLSYMYDFQGPCVSLDGACASSLVSLDLACQALRRRGADVALSAAVSLMLAPEPFIALGKMGALSPDARCRTFDAGANGYARGEGGAVLVLKRLSDATRNRDRILALVRGVAVHHGGRSNGLTAPNVRSQVAVIQAAHRDAGISASDVAYVEAHGTGTSLGDPIEMAALAEVFGASHSKARPLRVGSVKTNIGHCETAAGMAGLIKVVLALRNDAIPPHLHLREPSAHIDWSAIPVEIPLSLTPWRRSDAPRIAGVSAFGFNGTVTHAVLSEAPAVEETTAAGSERPLHVLTFSGRDEAALDAATRAFAEARIDAPFADVCYTANAGRDHFEHRAAVVAAHADEAREQLAQAIRGDGGTANRIAFVFAGQGTQYAGMGRALYETEPLFRQTIDDCAELLRPHLDVPLLDLLYGAAAERIDRTEYSQPALFAVEFALYQLWRSWGIRPAAVLGHSAGEYVAACAAGIFSLPDALRLIATRGRLVRAHSPAGRMAVVFAGAAEVQALINGHHDRVAVAAMNAPGNTVVSGESVAVQDVLDAAAAAGVRSRPLAVSHAFHSPLMEPVVAPFRSVLESMRLSRAALPIVSNRTGRIAAPDELSHAGAWCEHFLTPVLFSESVRTLEQHGIDTVIEIGPSAALSALGPESSARMLWTPSLRKGGDDWRSILTSLARLHVRGANVDWRAFDAPYGRRTVSIPTYPFQRKRFWIDAPASAPKHDVAAAFAAVRTLGRKLLTRAMRRIDAGAILPAYARLFDWLQQVLADCDARERDDSDLDGLGARVAAAHPEMAAVVRLLEVCLDAYPDVLTGRRNAVEVLFPGGSTEMLEAVYQNGRISEQFNAMIAAGVREAVRGRTTPAAILEIGAGTGGASKGVLEALLADGANVTYDYTDVTPALTRQAQERWGARFPFARFRVLDIEKDVAAQQFAPASYDVIVASNVLHATRSMARTLANTATLLKPGGVLVLNEVTQLHEFLGMTFGLTPGWWLYEDDALRTGHSPLLTASGWRDALAREGVTVTDVRTLDGDDAANPRQAVMIARREAVQNAPRVSVPHASIADQLTATVRRIAGIEIAPRDRDANLFELGLDSLVLMQLKQAVEQEFGVSVSMGQFSSETSTIERLAAYVGERTAVVATAPPSEPAAPVAHAEPAVPAEEAPRSAVEEVIHRQLDLMAQQLDLLRNAGHVARTSARATEPLPDARAANVPAAPRLNMAEAPAVRPAQALQLTPTQRLFLDDLIRRYNARTRRSKESASEARPYHADWIASIGFQQELKELIYPIVSARSEGSLMWDVDGNRYVDLAMGFGVGFFGHQPPFVKEAILRQLDNGFELGTQGELAAATARLVCELTGCERVAFSNTGTEAIMTAFRLARTVTRKPRIAYFKGSFHGSYDGVLAYGAGGQPMPAARGILQHQVDDVLVLEYGDEASLRTIEAEADTLAGVLVEPVQSRNPDLQPRHFLHELRRITAARGIALIFDEMITGFRVHPGGAQAYFGVAADIVTYGKILGAGMPMSAIAGRAEYLDALDGGAWSYGDDSRPRAETTFFGGTYCRHPLALAAAQAGLQFMKDAGPQLQETLNVRTADFAARLNALFADERVPLRVAWFSSQFQLRIATRTGETFQSFELALLFFLLLEKGIYTWERRICFLSVAHSDADLAQVFAAFRDAVREMKAAGFFGAEPQRDIRLTDGQKELWFLASQSEAASSAYAETLVLELRGALDRARLQSALETVVARHDALRTIAIDGDVMRIAPRLDVRIDEEEHASFDLARGPLFRVTLAKSGDDTHRLTIALHHIIADGWSIGVFVEELARAYSGAALPPATSFREYVEWSRARRASNAGTAFWQERLRTPPRTLDLPSDRPRPARRRNRGGRIRLTLDRQTVDALASFCRARQSSLFMTMLAAYEVFLHRVARMSEIVTGIAASGHAAMGVERMIGQCSGVLPFVARIDGGATFAGILAALKPELLRAYEHQELRREELALPEVRASFNQDRVPARLDFARLDVRVLPTDVRFVKYDLALNAMELGGEILLDFDYDGDLFDRATVETWAHAYAELLAQCIASAETPVREHALRPGCRVADWSESEELWCGTHRVRPRELEALLETHPRVSRARVELREDGALVARADASGCDAAELRRFLARTVPPYLVPSAFAFAPHFDVWDSGTRHEPANDGEAALLAIFREVLKLDSVGVHDDFFLLGGQSIAAVQIVMRAGRAFGVHLALDELFRHRTIAALARRIADAGQTEPIPATPPASTCAASHAQRRLWFLSQVEGEEAAYDLPGAYRFDGRIDAAALEAAFRTLIARHEILRTTFTAGMQHIHEAMPFALDVEFREEQDVDAAVRAELARESTRVFDLERGPLLVARLLRFAGADVLVYNVHHIVCDGWSQSVMIRELSAAYEEKSPLPAPRIQYRDAVAWQQRQLEREAATRARAYWMERLAGEIPRLELPAGGTPQRSRFRIGGETTRALRELANGRGCTMYMLCVALVKTLLHRYSGAEDVVVGTPVAGREHPDLETQLGCYVNTLVLRDRVSGDAAFVEILDRVRETVLEAFAHQSYPFDLLVDDLGLPRDLRRPPLFDVLVTMQNNETLPFVLGGVEGRAIESDAFVPAFDLAVDFAEEGEELSVVVETGVARLAGHLEQLAHAVVASDGPIAALDFLLDEERATLARFNDTAVPFDEHATIVSSFEAQVRRTPDRVALVDRGRTLTYAQLAARANALAVELRERGIGRENFVALLLPRGAEPVVGIMGVLAAGAAYVPLDPEQPPQRLREIVHHCGCSAIVADATTAALAREIADAEPVLLGDAELPGTLAIAAPAPSDLAYVIYTSGTTGTPKGVMIEHRSVVNMIGWMEREIYAPHGPHLQEAMLAPFVFDTSVQQIFGSLFRGNTLHVVADEVRHDPRLLGHYFRTHGIELVEFTPSLLLHALKGGLDTRDWSMKQVCVGAEMLPRQLVELFFADPSRRGVRLTNLYGPTECCANTTWHHLTPDALHDPRPIPIGRPLSNTRIVICDAALRPVPLGVTGELCVAGAGLARGYRGDAATTSARFVETPEGRLYRTGDLGRWREDGAIELAGRNDEQTKIRGVRVDPVEIENRLLAHDAVSQAAVVARRSGEAAELVAYFVPRAETNVAALREHLAATLPGAMVPAMFVQLADLPRTPGGKVDKRALPAPDDALVRRSAEYEEPRDAVEAALLRAWRDVLPVGRIGIHDSFFEVGGNSLRAVQLCARIRETTGAEIRLRDFFGRPTIAALASLVRDAARPALPPIARVADAASYPLSPGQRRLWLLDRTIAGRAAYNMAGTLLLEGALDIARLAAALAALQQRHESLRTLFAEIDGEPRQQVSGSVALPFTVEDLRAEADPCATARERATHDAAQPFDLAVAPLWRARLFVTGDEQFALYVNLHHIISDGWSVDLFVRQLADAYRGTLDAAPLPLQYRDYASWLALSLDGDAARASRDFWSAKLAGAPRAELPLDRPRTAVRAHRGATLRHPFGGATARGLQQLAASLGVTPFPLLLALVKIAIARYSGQDDVVTGTAVAGRDRVELEEQLGFFVNTLALRDRIDPGEPFARLVQRVAANVAEALDHAAYPFDRVVADLNAARDGARTPLFDVVVTLDEEAVLPDFGALRVRAMEDVARGSHFELFLSFVRAGDAELRLELEYDTDLFDAWRIERLAAHVETLAASAIAAPAAAVRDLEMLAADERRQLLETFNDTATAYPSDRTIDALFREQAALHADRVAVVHGARSLTYRELDLLSDRVARALAVEPEELVGVQMERSPEMVAALLGVLKAGAAYVPIDPSYPPARIEAMRAGLRTVLTNVATDLTPSGDGRPPLPTSLAYVMYTSGSEGKPKGVAVEHRAVVRLVRNANYVTLGPDDVILQTGALSFDATTFELWGALLNGARVVLPSQHQLLDVRAMRRLIAEQRVTVMWLTSSLLNGFVDADVTMFAPLRHLLTGGERLSPHHIAALRAQHPSLRISNCYGPTENTTFSTAHAIDACDGVSDLPIGRPIANSRVYILGAHDALVPVGVPGEICVAGDGLARGYHNDAELTRARFVEHPHVAGERIYRTGDLGCWRPDGTVAYLGRRDSQVKLRGVRIELGEIEAALLAQPGCRRCAVLVHDEQLVAYVVGESLRGPAMRAALAEVLPEGMVPARVLVVDRLPVDPNGKLDAATLRAMPADAAETVRRAPSNELEAALLAIWQSLLGNRELGVDDNFFEAGGHSLIALRLVNRIREELATGIDIADLFAAPTVAALATRVVAAMLREKRGTSAVAPIPRAPRREDAPLSSSQRRLWLVQEVEHEPAAYNIFAAFRIEGALDARAFCRAVELLAQRHEVLRTTFLTRDGEPRQRVRDDLPFACEEVAGDPAELMRAEASRPFDLANELPIRARLLRVADGQWLFLLNVHHLVADEWSMQVMQDELAQAYDALRRGDAPSLPPLRIQFRDFAEWESGRLGAHEAYWSAKLAAPLARLELPSDFPRPAKPSRRGDTLTVSLGADVTDALRALARARQTSLFSVFTAVVKVLLYRITGEEDVVVGTPAAGRTHADLERQVGFYARTLPLRDRVSATDRFDELLDRVRATAAEALEHQEHAFEQLPVDVMVAFEEAAPRFALDGVDVTPLADDAAFSKFDLMFIARDRGERLEVAIEYATDLFTRARIERMHAQLETLARGVTGDPAALIGAVELLGADERRRIESFRGTREACAEATLVELFEAQVAKTPEALAVAGPRGLTYRELNERAGRIAATLRSRYTIAADTRIGLLLPRDERLIAAMLGILKAGAAWVPADGNDPRERGEAMFADAGCVAVIDDAFAEDAQATCAPASIAPHDLAYVIFTSGSTGRPKGVMIEHRSVVNLVRGLHREIYARYDGPQQVALVASQAFDASVQQIFAALLGGHTLHVVDDETRRDGRLLMRFLRDRGITISDGTPSLLGILVDSGLAEAEGLALRHLIIGGEALTADLASRVRVPITNVYGPTECTVDATFHHVGEEQGAVPIGRPFANVEAYVLDAQRQLVPIGVTGEIHLGGDGLARGYAGDAALTAERFIVHDGVRLYRTGDYGRWRDDGALEFQGRRDGQLKIRGHRIESGEIEHVLASAPGVRQAAVCREGDALVAYVAGADVDASALRAHVAERLPKAMVPSRFTVVRALPLNRSGKIDRAALSSLDAAPAPSVAPRGEIEEAIAAIWSEVLGGGGKSMFGRDDDFFDAGGHSLAAARLLGRVHARFGAEIRLRDFFDAPTIAGLARLIAVDDFPLTHAQRRLWVLDQIREGSLAYSMPAAYVLHGTVDADALRRAFARVVERHESLRTVIVARDGEPRQQVRARGEVAFAVEEASEEAVRDIALREAAVPFDLANGPLVRLRLLRVAPDRGVLLFNMHHIAGDGASLDVFVRELAALYDACRAGGDDPLPPPRFQYRDFVAREGERLRSTRAARDRAYWLEQMRAPIPALSLPADFARPPVRSDRGDSVAVTLDASLVAALRGVARAHGASLFMAGLALFQTLLHRYTGDEDLIVGIPVAGRGDADAADQIGLFATTLPIRGRAAADMPFAELLAQLRGTLLDALDHDAWPLDLLVDDLKLARDASRSPLFDVLLAWQERDPARHLSGSLTVEPLELPAAAAGFDLNVALTETGDALSLVIRYSTDLFRRERIERMAAHFVELARGAAADPRTPLARLPLVPDHERAELFALGNVHGVVAPPEETVMELFARHVAAKPHAIAVECDGRALTYAELDARANGLARRLAREGIGPETRVAVELRRSEWLVVAIAAILKAGAVYVPVEPSLPAERKKHILADSSAAAVLVDDDALAALAAPPRIPVRAAAIPDPEPVPCLVSPENLAYVLYTSGSTGQPKGAMLEHRNVTAFAREIARACGLRESDAVYAVASVSFDVSVQELFCPLMQGLRIVVASDEAMYDPARMLADIDRSGATAMKATPTRLRMLVDEAVAAGRRLGTLRVVTAGGETLPLDLHDRLLAMPGVELFVTYGPTEATVSVTTGRMGSGTISIGRPLAHTSIVILGGDGSLQPRGVPGEICIGGFAVGRCYLNSPELTASRFVDDPFRPGGRLYRTGDIGRWLDNGEIEFLGRNDRQVKIRGQRIEPGEVEAALMTHPAVRRTTVIARPIAGAPELIAYVEGETIAAEELRRHLLPLLPPAAVPSAIVFVEQWPLGPTGKLDTRVLPDPELRRAAEVVPPADALERQLVALWEEVLSRDGIGVTDDFFELGGHSLRAAAVAARVQRDLGVRVKLARFFLQPTVRGLAALVREAHVGTGVSPSHESLQPVPTADTYEVSPAQRRIWVLSQLESEARAYHLPYAQLLEGPLDFDALREAFRALVARHESLRTVFVTDASGAPRQRIADVALDFEECTDLSEEIASPFDLAGGPLLRVRVLRLAPERHVLFVALHHIVSDWWSSGVLARDLSALYRGAAPLPPLRVQYKDYAAWRNAFLRSAEGERERRWWLDTLAGELPRLELPADHARPPVQSFRGATLDFTLDRELVAALRDLGARGGATPFVVLVAAVKMLLHRYCGADDVVVGTPVAGRDLPELEPQIGMYLNTLALRTRVDGGRGFAETVARVKETVDGALEHASYPFDELVEALGVERDLSRSPLFDVFVVMQNRGNATLALRGLETKPFPLESDVSKFDLTFGFIEEEEVIRASIEFSTDLFRHERIAAMWSHFVNLLRGALAMPEEAIGDLPMLSAAEAEALLSREAAAPEDEASIAALFERQALERAQKIAIACDGRTLTYAQLDARANALAARLREEGGVRAGDVVAIELPRSEEYVVSVLAVLKAGAAYLPLDPSLPHARRELMLEDSGSSAVIAGDGVRARAGGAPLHDGSLAYVIYTSGSTGRPKGVLIEQRNVVAMLRNLREVFGLDETDVVFASSAFSFDISALEILLPLLSGMTVAMATDGELADPARTLHALRASGATLLQTTPTRLSLLLQHGHLATPSLRTLLVGGEALPRELCATLAALPDIRAFNVYGPTETTIWSTAHEIREGEVSIGRPLRGESVLIVSDRGQLLPVGVPGEIVITGSGVGRGYLHRPELTAARFAPHPLRPGERAYRTGDVGRWCAGGTLECLGRRDGQVKVRGHRIELGEIESLLAEHPKVVQAAAALVDVAGSDELVAYVTGQATEAELREHLGLRLPRNVIPAHFVLLEAMPQLASGKIDRKALPHPAATQAATGGEAPCDATEAALVAIWESVLARTGIGVTDNFFAAGGHSLRAAQLANRVRQQLGLDLSLRDVFEHPTVRELAAHVRTLRLASQPPLRPAPEAAHYPLSHAQRRLWAAGSAFDIGGAYLLEGPLDIAALERAFRELIARHETLRTSFHVIDGEPRQIVHPSVEFTLHVDDAEMGRGDARKPATFEPFDLAVAPLFRAHLLRLGPERHVLRFRMHHIIGDGWSLDVLLPELEALYSGESLRVPALQYKDFAVWERELERSGAWQRSRAYWMGRLSGELPRVVLPADRPRSASRSHRGGVVPFAFGEELTARVRQLNQRRGTTPFMTLLAATSALVHRLTGQCDLILGSVTSGREHADLERQAGCFVNLVPLRIAVQPDEAFASLLARVRQESLDALQHAAYPYDLLAADLRSRRPLFDVGLAWNAMEHVGRTRFGDCTLAPFGSDDTAAEYDLLIYAAEAEGRISGALKYSSDLFDRSTMERFAEQLVLVVEQAAEDDARALADLALDAGAAPPPPEPRVQIHLDLGNEAP